MSERIVINDHVTLRFPKKRWWIPLIEGILLIALGVFALIEPFDTFAALWIVIAIFLIVNGIVAIVGGIMSKGAPDRWWIVVIGVVGILLGVMALVWPKASLAVLMIFLAAWLLVGGIYAIVRAVEIRKLPNSEWGWTLAWGIVAILLALMLIIWPVTSALAVVATFFIFFGILALIGGILLIVASLRLRKNGKIEFKV